MEGDFMKIEKITDYKIRCTLSGEDLKERNLNITELAYGTDKAKDLFSDMMERAKYQYGVCFDGNPLMIEVVSSSPDNLILTITSVKVDNENEDSESDDDGFESFQDDEDFDEDDEDNKEHEKAYTPGEIDLRSIFGESIFEKRRQRHEEEKHSDKLRECLEDYEAAFVFDSIDDVIAFSKLNSDIYIGDSKLYKLHENGNFILILWINIAIDAENGEEVKLDAEVEDNFYKVLCSATEYGHNIPFDAVYEAYLNEHEELWIDSDVIDKLGNI